MDKGLPGLLADAALYVKQVADTLISRDGRLKLKQVHK